MNAARYQRKNSEVLRDFGWTDEIRCELECGEEVELIRDYIESISVEEFMKTVRLQYEIPEDRLEALDEIMREAGMKTRTELFNNATTLLKWAIKQRKEGRAIASINFDDNSFRELEMPIFENVGEVQRAESVKASKIITNDHE